MSRYAKLVVAAWIYSGALSALCGFVASRFVSSSAALWPVLAIFLGGGLSGTLIALFDPERYE